MANSYPYAVKYSTENMVAKAYKEYTASVSEKYAVLMDAVQSTINSVESDSDLNELVGIVISDMGTDYSANTNVPLNEGVVSLHNYLLGIANTVKKQMIEIDHETIVDDAIYDSPLEGVTLLDGTPLVMSLNNALTELNATFHSVVVENAVATAYELGSSVADRITIMRDTIGEKFQSMYTDISDTVNDAVNKIKSGMGVSEYIKKKIESSGIQEASDSNTNISESSDATYTGASPASAYAFFTARSMIISAAVTAVKTVYGAVKSVLQSVYTIGRKFFRKVVNKLVEVTVNPKDLVSINGVSGNHTADGFYIQKKYTVELNTPLYKDLLIGPVHFDLFSGEFIIQKDSVTSDNMIVDVFFKPKCLNYKLFQLMDHGTDPNGDFLFYTNELVKVFDIAIDAPDTYLDVDSNEAELLMGFIYGIWISGLLSQALMIEANGIDIGNVSRVCVSKYASATITEGFKQPGDTINNLDFVNICANGLAYKKNSGLYVDIVDNSFAYQVVSVINNVFNYKQENPFNYAFWPYSRNYVSWFDASFRIKTDAENKDAFTNFVSTAIVVVSVMVISAFTFVKLKKHATKALVEAMGQEWKVTELASQGKLTNKSIKPWRKAKRKANTLNFLTGNLTSTAKNVGSNSFNSGDDVISRLEKDVLGVRLLLTD